MGIAGEMLSHSHGASKTKKSTHGTTTNRPVAILIGLSFVFCQRPPKQKMVLPSKNWCTRPAPVAPVGVGGGRDFGILCESMGRNRGDEFTEDNFSAPSVLRFRLVGPWSLLPGSRKLERNERGVRRGLGMCPRSLELLFASRVG